MIGSIRGLPPPPLALGVRMTLWDARRRCIEETSEPPQRFTMHPRVFKALVQECAPDTRYMYEMQTDHRDGRSGTIFGVAVFQDSRSARPSMLTVRNVVEYL